MEFEFEIKKRKESNEFKIERSVLKATETNPVEIEEKRSIEGDELKICEQTNDQQEGAERNQIQNLGTSKERTKLDKPKPAKLERESNKPRKT